MRLKKLEIRGYKRFREPQAIFSDGKLTAIVGPNEAGKTSLLEAFAHITEGEEFLVAGDGAEISRGLSVSGTDLVVEGLFRVDDKDRQLLSEVPGGDEVRWFFVGRAVNGELRPDVKPKPKRDKKLRVRVEEGLARLEKSRWLRELTNEEADLVFGAITEASSEVASDSETLSSASLVSIEETIEVLADHGLNEGPQYGRVLLKQIESLVDFERREHPAEKAARLLWEASPDFVFFREEDRSLASSYDLAVVAGNPPAALDNLCHLAGLQLTELHRARTTGDHGLITTLVEKANETLRQRISNSWSQSTVEVRLWEDGGTLRVQAQTENQGYWNIAERSDGLRAFVALTAFLAVSGHDRPVLLIDEAEAHLHYDAQADLVQMLSKQGLASQVIYTTHSAGCLPEDLASVRLVVPRANSETSDIRNWFWEGGEPGVGPLLLGMGAATLAFIPTRYAVLTEGPSDFVLLPAVLREASGQETLGYQVTPGLAEARPAEIAALDLQAARVAYVVDNDTAGDQIVDSKLKGSGIDSSRIFRVSSERGQVLEDLIEPHLYVQAVNSELGLTGAEGPAVGDLPTPNRAAMLNKWCSDRSIEPPSKRAVAQYLVRLKSQSDIDLLTTEGTKSTLDLHQRLVGLFDLNVTSKGEGEAQHVTQPTRQT